MAELRPTQPNQSEVVVIESYLLESRCSSDFCPEDITNHEKIPKTVWLILSFIFLAYLSYFFIRYALFQHITVAYDSEFEVAAILFYSFSGIIYPSLIIGATLSDSFYGKRTTIIQMSTLYLFGIILLMIFSINNFLGTFGRLPIWSYIFPSTLVGIGYGGLLSCIYSLGGDQINRAKFNVLDKYFAWLFIITHTTSYLGSFVPHSLHLFSFGSNIYSRIYILTLGLTTIIFIIGFIIFLLGYKRYYVASPQKKFIPMEFIKIFILAVKNRNSASTSERVAKGYWLKFAEETHSLNLVEELRLFGKVFIMLVPWIFYFILSSQSKNVWDSQSYMMSSHFFDYSFMSIHGLYFIHIVLSLTLVFPLTCWLYPFLKKKGINTSLVARLNWGYLLMLAAFLVSIFIQYGIEATYTLKKSAEGSNTSFSNSPYDCENCLNLAWQIPQWLLYTLSNVIVSPAILQFAYTQVGTRLKASSIALCMVISGAGSYVFLAIELTTQTYYRFGFFKLWVYFAISFISYVIFGLLSKKWFVSREDENANKQNNQVDQSFQL